MPVIDLPKPLLESFPQITPELDDRGLLALGGDLSPERLLAAYHRGVFPWFGEHDPILWWSPNPRMIIRPGSVHVSRRLLRQLRKQPPRISTDTAFETVMQACAAPRAADSGGTWITDDMLEAYCRLNSLGFAHSVEVWLDEELVGGIYGVSLGRAFFGESMFTQRDQGSKIALIALCALLERQGVGLLDCQMHTGHLQRMGGQTLPRPVFLREVAGLTRQRPAEEWCPVDEAISWPALEQFCRNVQQERRQNYAKMTAGKHRTGR